MGLSDEERTEKIYFSLWRMTQADRLERLREEYPTLVDKLEKLWPAFLGKSGNGLYWFMGSGVTNEVMRDPTLFSVAVRGNLSRGQPDCFDRLRERREEEIEKIADPVEKKKEEDRIDQCNYQSDYHPTFEKILQRNAPELADVYAVYEDCENIRYALNRYRDKYAKRGSELDSLVSNILGECFNIFTTESRVREAWYTFQIANRVMYQRIRPEHTIVKIWRTCNLHHDVGIGVHDLDELHNYWAKIQLKQTLTTEECVLGTLWLLQRRFHYEHQLKSVMKILKEHNKTHPKDRVNLAKVEKMFWSHNHPAHERYESRTLDPVEHCRLSGQTIERKWRTEKPKKKRKK